MCCLCGCEDVKFIEKVTTVTTVEYGSIEAEYIEETTLDDDSWKTQTLASETESVTEIPTEIWPEVTTIPEQTEQTHEVTEIVETTTSVSIDNIDYTPIEEVDIVFIGNTEAYKSEQDTDPIIIKKNRTAVLKGIYNELYVINYHDELFLISNLETVVNLDDYLNSVTSTESEYEDTTITTTTTQATTAATTTVEETTTTTEPPQTTTTPPPTTTTVPPTSQAITTTTPVVTTQTSSQSEGLTITGNRGGVDFPDDLSNTNIVFGITFVNMDNTIILVNDVYISSGPGNPSKANGYINLGIVEADTQLQCIGISYDGWLRVKLPSGKIGFVYNTDAIIA